MSKNAKKNRLRRAKYSTKTTGKNVCITIIRDNCDDKRSTRFQNVCITIIRDNCDAHVFPRSFRAFDN